MIADEDRRRLLESRHDLDASEPPANLTAQAEMHGAIAVSRAELQQARETLRSAADGADREKSETDVERIKLQQAIGAAIRRYGFIRGKVEDALLNVDPDAQVAPGEIVRRQRLVGRVFRAAPSDLERLGQGAVIETIAGVAKALSDEPDLAPLDLAAPLSAAHAAAQAAAKELNRETDEDAAAMTALRDARAALDRAAEAHALLVTSILVRARREAELGRFVLAKDLAYAARRTARTPLGEEPGIGDVDAEPPSASQAPGASTPS